MRPVDAAARSVYPVLAATDALLAAGGPAVRRVRWVTKPLLMPSLAARLAIFSRDDPAVRRTLVAQAFSWGGDVALMGTGRRPFLAGLTSFLAAHLAYVAAFRSRSSGSVTATAAGRAALGAGLILAPAMGLAAARRDPRLAVPVAAYGMVLSTMVVTSAAIAEHRGRRQVLTGTSLFLLSDTLLGVRTFLLADRSPAMDAAVMASYTAAQWFISEGLRRS